MRTMTRFMILGPLILMIAGCVPTIGRDFKNPDLSGLVMGRTTPSDVAAIYGEPFEKSLTVTTSPPNPLLSLLGASSYTPLPVPGSRENIRYFYRRGAEYKSLGLLFFNGNLVEYEFGDNFANHSTDFDEGKIAGLIRNQTTKAEMVALLGHPAGEAIYPQIPNMVNSKARYYFELTTGQVKTVKRLDVLFNGKDIVIDYNYGTSALPVAQLAPVAAGAVYVPPVTVKKGK